jgi:hypothetical protein
MKKRRVSQFAPPGAARIPAHIRAQAEAAIRGDSPEEVQALREEQRKVNVRRGVSAKASGANFEELLSMTHAWYVQRGVARVLKLEPETGGPPTALHYIAPAEFDYIGPWCPGTSLGPLMEVAFDAKVYESPTLQLPTQIKRRTGWSRQIGLLQDHAAIHPNVVPFFLLWSNDQRMGWVASLDVLVQVKAGGQIPIWRKKRGETTVRHYLPQVHLTPAPYQNAVRYVDYLATLARMRNL